MPSAAPHQFWGSIYTSLSYFCHRQAVRVEVDNDMLRKWLYICVLAASGSPGWWPSCGQCLAFILQLPESWLSAPLPTIAHCQAFTWPWWPTALWRSRASLQCTCMQNLVATNLYSSLIRTGIGVTSCYEALGHVPPWACACMYINLAISIYV